MFHKKWFLLFIGIFNLQFNIIEPAASNQDDDDTILKQEIPVDILLEYICDKYPAVEKYLLDLFMQISQKNVKIYELETTIKELIAQMEIMNQSQLAKPKSNQPKSNLNPSAEPYRRKNEV